MKGGVGKTTLTFNFGEWLAQSHQQKVLLIDADAQSSLSQTYDIYQPRKSLIHVFEDYRTPASDLIVHQANLDILPSSVYLNEIEASLATQTNKELILYMWLSSNYDYLKQYDYILIDCHPDFQLVTKNAIAASDLIFSPVEPSRYSLTSQGFLTEEFDRFRRELVSPQLVDGKHFSYVDAKLYFIGNRLKDDELVKPFVDQIKQDKRVKAFIPENILFNQSTLFATPIVNMQHDPKYQNQQEFFKNIFTNFDHLVALRN